MSPSRRWVWGAFAVCAALLMLALGALSYQVLRLERQQASSRVQRERDEATRRSLLRMDSLLAPMMASEARRPYFDYRGVRAAGRPYGLAMEPPTAGEALEPSALLLESAGAVSPPGLPPEVVVVRFQIEPAGVITSPEAPEGGLLASLLSQRPTVPLDLGRIAAARASLEDLRGILGPGADQLPAVSEKPEAEVEDSAEADAGDADYQFRQRVADIARNVESRPPGRGGERASSPGLADGSPPEGERVAWTRGDAWSAHSELKGALAASGAVAIETGPLEPVWVGGESPELLLLRRVTIGERVYTQGVWISWEALRGTLLESVADIAPGSELVPATTGGGVAELETRLATIPARLVLGESVGGVMEAGLTPARWGLGVMWAGLIGAAVATALALRATLRLADRRGRFVSAVTHELRTPLTSFRLYSQMLASGMVTDDDAKREYLQTLDRESARLGETVENVLAYARLDRSSKRSRRPDPIEPQALLARVVPALSRRAERDGMDLVVSQELGEAAGRVVYADPSSVERILLNLVENACKYASPAQAGGDAETRVHLDADVAGDRLEVVVSDYGPGIAPEDRGRVFGEFVRGEAGERADRGGLGLGLALARGLARDAGGDLGLVRRRGGGAEFLLWLPMQGRGDGGSPRAG